MSLLNLKKFGFMAAGVGLFAIVAAQGCSSDETQAMPSGGSGGRASTAGAAGSAGSGAKAGEGNHGGAAGMPDEPGAGGTDAEGGAAGAIDPGCIGDDGCYKCEPKTNDQFLNACVEGGCPATFDNGTLSKIDLVGTL